MSIRRQKRKLNKAKAELPEWILQAAKVLKPPDRITVSQWADRYRILDEKSSNQSGPWRTSVTPYLAGIMDAFTDPAIEEIWVCKCTQIGGTEAEYNMLGYALSQDGAPTMFVYPILELAEYASKNRIQPMIELCSSLNAIYRQRISTDMELQFDGSILVLSGANSPSSLASRPIRYLFLDEVDKYPSTAGREADPIRLAIERTKTYPTNRKIVGISTPTGKTGNIWRAWETASEQRKYFVPCPHCGHYQTFDFKQLKWPAGVMAEDARDLASYECAKCKGTITDVHKMQMIRAGEWRAISTHKNARSVGFHINVFYSPWVRFGDIAYEYLKSKEYPDLLKNFINSWLAEPWQDETSQLSSDIVMARQTSTPEGIVPKGARLLTAGVDVQGDRLYWTIRAWGERLTSWGIAHGMALSFSQIEQIMNIQWQGEDGNKYTVNLCCIDSGDQTEDVYDFCAINADWCLPVKGSSHAMYTRYKISKIDMANSKAYGMSLILVDTASYKDMIASRLNRPNGRGSWMVYAGCDLDYAEQVTSEEKVVEKRGASEVAVWRPKTIHAQNHYLDAEVYAAVAGDLLHVRYMTDDPPIENTVRTEQPIEQKPNEKSWLPNKRRWI
jgi:phage terminase large subunit GpA-like protein